MQNKHVNMQNKRGYPTEEELNKIKTWEIHSIEDYHALMRYIKSLWAYPDYFKRDYNYPDAYRLVTGGWSGNVQIIQAMNENHVLIAFYWYSSDRGGLHIFRS